MAKCEIRRTIPGLPAWAIKEFRSLFVSNSACE
jgi:hypothetical protein